MKTIFEILGRGGRTASREFLYRVRCRRCGAESEKPRSQMAKAVKSCGECRSKVSVYGVLLPIDELLAVTGMKKTLFWHRTTVKKWSVERTLSTPIREAKRGE